MLSWFSLSVYAVLFLSQVNNILKISSFLGGAWIFIWKFVNVDFVTNLSRLQNAYTFKVKSVKLMLIIMSCIFLSVVLASALHPLFGYLWNWEEAVAGFAKEMYFISSDGRINTIIITLLQFFDLWLNFLYFITVIYMMAIFIHFHQEFKHLCSQLCKLIKSGDVYRVDSFSKWRKYFSIISVLVEDLNDNMKLYIYYTPFYSDVLASWEYYTIPQCPVTQLWAPSFGV